MLTIDALKQKVWTEWDNFFGTPDASVDVAWNIAQREGDVKTCMSRGCSTRAYDRLFFKMEAYQQMYLGMKLPDEPQQQAESQASNNKEVVLASDAADTMRLQALVLHELMVGNIGEHVREFRKQFTEGRVLAFDEVDRFIKSAVLSHRSEDHPAQANSTCLDKEFYWLIDRPLFVSPGSCLWSANRLARTLTAHYDWRLSDAVMFLLTASIPAMFPLRIKDNSGSMTEALLFSSRNTTPLTLKVMPWVSPSKVADALRAFQNESWVGKAKAASKSSLRNLVFVLSEQHKRQQTKIGKAERRAIFEEVGPENARRVERGRLAGAVGEDAMELSVGEDASRLFDATDRTLRLLTTSSEAKRRTRKDAK